MNNIRYKTIVLILDIGVLYSLLLCASCSKKDNPDMAPPVLSAIATLNDRATHLDKVTYSQWILIKGYHLATTTKVEFNGTPVPDSVMYANDTSITVKVPGPLKGATDNPITVHTKYGQATMNFVVLQPPPIINSFTPVSGSTGDVVTITGDWFTNIVSVKFGDVPATIVSSNKTEIKIKVPDNVALAYIFVTTSGGTTKSAGAFGFKYIIYDDLLNSDWWKGGWGGTADFASTEMVKRGTHAIKINYIGGWGSPMAVGTGITIGASGFTALKISIYGGVGSNTNKVKLILNGAAADGQELILEEGKWTDYTIPLNTLGNPSVINGIWLQEFSNGATKLIYVDDIGLI